MPRSRHSQSRRLVYSGALSYEAEPANLNSYGFDTSAGLDELTLASPTALGHPTFGTFAQQPALDSDSAEYGQAYFASYQTTIDTGNISGTQPRQPQSYWQTHGVVSGNHTPLPSPPLLSANSLNLPPLFTARQNYDQHVLLSHNVPYDYPAPPDIPYAESAVSAASSNLSPPEDENGFRGPLDDEKRRRNLAASARFRQKKRLREQQLEQQTKELHDKASGLEEKISELRKENDFLKALLTEQETDMTPDGRRRFHELALLVEHGEY